MECRWDSPTGLVLQQIADAAGSRAFMWRGSDLPTVEQGIKVLGTLSGSCWNPPGPSGDVQCAWNLLLHSAAARANCQLRVVRPELTTAFAQGHDDGVWSCLCDPTAAHTRQVATLLPLSWWIGTSERNPHQADCLLGELGIADTMVLPLDFRSVSYTVWDHRRWLQRTRLAKSCQV